MRTRRLLLLCSTATLALTTGCSAPAATPAAEPSSSPSSSSASPADEDSPSAAGAPRVLLASVRTEGDPGAFEIALTDEDGKPVTEVAAGDWTIEVKDYAKIHNFHPTGAGVDKTTTVPGTDGASWKGSFTPGEHDDVCDPHSGSMSGTLAVT